MTKIEAFADNKLTIAKMIISVFDRVESLEKLGKGENAGHQQFLLFPQCFSEPSSFRSLKSGLCGKELILIIDYLALKQQRKFRLFQV